MTKGGGAMKRIVNILEKEGPMLSGDLAKLIQDRYKISYDLARKIISRATSPVHKIRNIVFERNQKFVYLQGQYNSEQYFQCLYEAMKNSAKNYYYILLALQNNGGYISKSVLASYVAAPVENLTRHKRFDQVILALINSGFISEFNDDYYKIIDAIMRGTDFKKALAIELAKKTVVDDFGRWAKNINLVAYNSAKGFYENAVFGKFQWGFTAPSYISDIYNISSKKPGFIIADVIIDINVTEHDIQFFVDKINILRNYKNIPRFIPFLLVDSISKEALNLLKNNQIVCAILGNLFSKKYADVLRELVGVVRNASAIINNDSSKVNQYLERIEFLEGKMGNLIGDLFEISVGYYFHQVGCRYFEINKIVSYNGQYKEIDVFVERDGKVKVVECKGIKSPLDHNYAKKWLTDNVPIIFAALKGFNPNYEIEFEIWSTGGYLNETKEMLEKAKTNTAKYSIDYLDGQQIAEEARRVRCEILKKSIISIQNR